MQHDVRLLDATWNRFARRIERNGLWNVNDRPQGRGGDECVASFVVCEVGMAAVEQVEATVREFQCGLFAHAVGDAVRSAIYKDTWAKAFLPVVIVHQPSHRCLDATENDWHVGVQSFENLGIDDCWVLGPQVMTAVGTVGVLRTQPARSRVFVDHRVHAPRCYSKPHAGSPQLLEVAQVTVPVWLGNNGNVQPFSFRGW